MLETTAMRSRKQATIQQVRHHVVRIMDSDRYLPYLLLAPFFLLVIVLMGYPLVTGIGYAFTNKQLVLGGTHFTGLHNFDRLLHDAIFWKALRHSVLWTVYGVAGTTALGLGMALLLNLNIPLRSFWRGVLLSSWVMPTVVLGIIFAWLYDPMLGWLNYGLSLVGLPAVELLANPTWALIGVSLPLIWRSYPFTMLFLLAGLQGIERELYEAASIDGAGLLRRFTAITVPSLIPVLRIVLLMQTIWIFNTFDVVWIMTKGGPADTTHLLSTYTYYSAFYPFDVGYASAVGVIMLVILLVFAAVYLRYTRREMSV